jgi:hypothetical protein
MRITTTHDFSSQDISDIFVGAIEGNDMTRAWCNGIYRVDNPERGLPIKGLVWYGQKEFFENPEWLVKIVYDDPNGEEGNASAALLVGEEEFRVGLQAMADRYESHFHDLIADGGVSADAITYDVVLQFVVLGDVIYG